MTRENIIVTYQGETGALKTICRRFDLNYGFIKRKMGELNIPFDEAVKLKPEEAEVYETKGGTGTFRELCSLYNVNESTARSRMRRGYSIDEAFDPDFTIRRETYTFRNFTGTKCAVCRKFGVSYQTLRWREKKYGETFEEAMAHCLKTEAKKKKKAKKS